MAALIAACTSRAAPSMLRSMSNCTMIELLPIELIGRYLGDASNFAQPSLQRRSDRIRHRLGIGTRPRRDHHNGGDIDAWQCGDRQEAISDDARQQQPERQQDGGDGPRDEQRGEAHVG